MRNLKRFFGFIRFWLFKDTSEIEREIDDILKVLEDSKFRLETLEKKDHVPLLHPLIQECSLIIAGGKVAKKAFLKYPRAKESLLTVRAFMELVLKFGEQQTMLLQEIQMADKEQLSKPQGVKEVN